MSRFAIVLAVFATILTGFASATTPAHAFFSGGAYGPYTGTIYMLGAEENRRSRERKQEARPLEERDAENAKAERPKGGGGSDILSFILVLATGFCSYYFLFRWNPSKKKAEQNSEHDSSIRKN